MKHISMDFGMELFTQLLWNRIQFSWDQSTLRQVIPQPNGFHKVTHVAQSLAAEAIRGNKTAIRDVCFALNPYNN